MKKQSYIIGFFIFLGVLQFVRLPFFLSFSQGGKILLFSVFVLLISFFIINKLEKFFVSRITIIVLLIYVVSILSLINSDYPETAILELYFFGILLIFCILISNFKPSDICIKIYFLNWLRVVGLIVASLCLYQFLDWTLYGTKSEYLISYLLPSGGSRVTGPYGQSNLTALLLLLAIVAFFYDYFNYKVCQDRLRGVLRNIGFFLVSYAFFLTRSRAGLLAFVIILVLVFFLRYREKLNFKLHSAIIPLLILSISLFVSLVDFAPLDQEVSTFNRGELSIDTRFFFWAASLLIFKDLPFLGAGLNHFKIHLSSYANSAHELLGFVEFSAMGHSSWSHNELLQLLAETGFFGGLFFCGLFVYLLLRFSKEISSYIKNEENIFLYILIVPFFVQSFFSWPLRYPPLLIIFFFILGLISRDDTSITIRVTNTKKKIVALAIIFLAIFGSGLAYKNHQFLSVLISAKKEGCDSDQILLSMSDFYYSFASMRFVLPVCLSHDSFKNNLDSLEKFVPFFDKIAKSQGTHSQWFNLGLVHRALGNYDDALYAFRKAVERQPEFANGWYTLHSLNIERAVQETGRPIEDFLPTPPKRGTHLIEQL